MIIDNFMFDITSHLEEILIGEFIDIEVYGQTFKGIQPRGEDRFSDMVLKLFPGLIIAYNFVRLSPIGQEEPNFIHDDASMADLTAILYLSRDYPEEDGTTLYDKNLNPTLVVNAKLNRLFIFESNILHSRNIYNNFGQGLNSRLLQVLFLKKP